MKVLMYVFLISLVQLTYFNTANALSSKRAAINIWLQQQQDINPRPLKIISTIKKEAQNFGVKINRYNINATDILISAKVRAKPKAYQLKRILSTTFMFNEIKLTKIKRTEKYFYFNLNLKKAKEDKREIYKKSKHAIFKSKTQVKYAVIDLIKKIKPIGNLTTFCQIPALKIKPAYIASKVKLIIYSYQLKFSGTFSKAKETLSIISNNTKYISTHNLVLNSKKSNYELDVDLRFYHQGTRRNSLDKAYVFEKVTTDKICN